jgi:hypothetical protein
MFFSEAEVPAADGFCSESDGESDDETMGRRMSTQPPTPDVQVEGRWHYLNKSGRYMIRRDPEVKAGEVGWRYEERLSDGRVAAGRLAPDDECLVGRLSTGAGEDKAYGTIRIRRGVGDTLVTQLLLPGGDEFGPEVVAKAEAVVAEAARREGNGDDLIFLGDTDGWIWCVDMAASLEASQAQGVSVPVIVPGASGMGGLPINGKDSRNSSSVRFFGGSGTSLGSMPTSGDGAAGSRLATFYRDMNGETWLEKAPSGPRPEMFRVVGAWPAHRSSVLSLAPSYGPPVLVSTSLEKEVKIWSTAGDLWGHFSLLGSDGVPPMVAVWPPPHVLSVQLDLMRTAKTLCKKMGFQPKRGKRDKEPSEGLLRQSRRGTAQRSKPPEEPPSPALVAAMAKGEETPEGRGGASRQRSAPSDSAGEQSATSYLERPDSGVSALTGASSPVLPSAEPDDGNSPAAASRPAESSRGVSRQSGVGTKVSSALAEDDGEGDFIGNSYMETSTSLGPEMSGQEMPSELEPHLSMSSHERSSRREKEFTPDQMAMMIKNHAFSSGFQSYGSFRRKGGAPVRRSSRVLLGVPEALDSGGGDQRRPSDFGVDLVTGGEAEAWQRSTQQPPRGMGRSASEGVLLNFAHSTSAEMSRHVREDFRVDVSNTSRAKIRRPSFAARLDVFPVSPEPLNPASATGQAVRKMQQVSSQRMLPPLLSAGQMAVEAPERSVRRSGRR